MGEAHLLGLLRHIFVLSHRFFVVLLMHDGGWNVVDGKDTR